MLQLLLAITETLNTSFPFVNFLKCVATVLSRLVFNFLLRHDISYGSVATHLRCGGIFSDGVISNFLLILIVK